MSSFFSKGFKHFGKKSSG